jgi:hypothetical protein
MTKFEYGTADHKTSDKKPGDVSLGENARKSGSDKKRAYRIRRIAEPHLFTTKRNGKPYWWYVRGVDKPIYLGDPDTILKYRNYYKDKVGG